MWVELAKPPLSKRSTTILWVISKFQATSFLKIGWNAPLGMEASTNLLNRLQKKLL
jgi:hypothetical protein